MKCLKVMKQILKRKNKLDYIVYDNYVILHTLAEKRIPLFNSKCKHFKALNVLKQR